MAAGHTAQLPLSARISMAGMSSDHTEAATITPEAKPSSDFCKRGDMSFFMKKTNEAPNIVPNNGINSPIVIPMTVYLFAKVQKNCAEQVASVPHIKTNSKFILKTYDKNLLQKYGGFATCEIPNTWDFLPISIINYRGRVLANHVIGPLSLSKG